MGTTGPQLQAPDAPDRSGQPGPNTKCQIAVALLDPNSTRQMATGVTGPCIYRTFAASATHWTATAGGPYRASASARSPCALPDHNSKSSSEWPLPGPNSRRQIAVDPNRKHQIAVSTTGTAVGTARRQRATASARSQWAPPDRYGRCRTPTYTKRQIAVRTTGPQHQTPDRSEHYRAPTASARSQWARRALNCKLSYLLQPVHWQTRVVYSRYLYQIQLRHVPSPLPG